MQTVMTSTSRSDAVLSPPGLANAFTVDVEDYYHVSAFEKIAPPEHWDRFDSRVVESTQRMLEVLARHDVRGTFYILGWVAQKFPNLVRSIHSAGHEIGCHSFSHRLVYSMTPDEFRADLRAGRSAIEDAIQEGVFAYRAPSFSITEKSLWALDILIEEGFRYDSSIFPIYHDRYGIPNAERFPHCISRPAGDIWEFPPSVHQLGKMRIPVAGGGYFRMYPAALTIRWLRKINREMGQPFMFYIHPWEIDPEQPRLAAPMRSRFRHYLNLSMTEAKLNRLLSSFTFAPQREVLARWQSGQPS